MQQTSARLAARTLERSTRLKNLEKQEAEKRVIISSIRYTLKNEEADICTYMVNRLAITNMAKYVATRAVLLPGDMEHGSAVQHGLSEQLRSILGHIEDMEVVKERVAKSDLTPGYMEPLASDKSDIRIDY